MLCNFSTDWILLQVVCGKHRQHINYEGNLKQQTNMCRKLFLFITNLFWYLFKLATYLQHTCISLNIVNIWQAVNLENVRKQIVSVIFHLSYSFLSCYLGNILSYLTERYTWFSNLLSNKYFINHNDLWNKDSILISISQHCLHWVRQFSYYYS